MIRRNEKPITLQIGHTLKIQMKKYSFLSLSCNIFSPVYFFRHQIPPTEAQLKIQPKTQPKIQIWHICIEVSVFSNEKLHIWTSMKLVIYLILAGDIKADSSSEIQFLNPCMCLQYIVIACNSFAIHSIKTFPYLVSMWISSNSPHLH